MSKELGVKFDRGKVRWTLLPFLALEEVLQVLEYGAQKYAPDNWQRVEGAAGPDGRYVNAALRHMSTYVQGGVVDEESGRHHLAHAVCCLLFALWFDLTGET